MKLSVAIMAHPKRKGFFPYLNKMLGNPPFAIDTGKGLWENARRAWGLYNPKCEFHTVIQDDTIICNNFLTRAVGAIEKSDTVFKGRVHLLNFYYDQMLTPGNSEEILKQKHIIRSKICWAVAICMPTPLIDEMLFFCDRLVNVPQDDEKITLFMKSKTLKCYFPIPSLVDHRTDVGSLVGNTDVRKAWIFKQ